MTWVIKTIGVCDQCGPTEPRELFYNTWCRALCWNCAHLEGHEPPKDLCIEHAKNKIEYHLDAARRLKEELERLEKDND